VPSGHPCLRLFDRDNRSNRLKSQIALNELKTQKTAANQKIWGRNIQQVGSRFVGDPLNHMAPVVRAGIFTLKTGAIGMFAMCIDNSCRVQITVLRRWPPEGQQHDCNDVTEPKHAPAGTEITHILSTARGILGYLKCFRREHFTQ
jgi:hypothetical protein